MSQTHNNDKVFLYNIQEEKEINDKIYGRNIPSMYLQPNLDLRPIPTKYRHFQLNEERELPSENLIIYPDYDPKINFNPGNRMPPFSYFAKNVDVETNLRNSKQLPELGFKVKEKAAKLVIPKENDSPVLHLLANKPNIDKMNLAPLLFNNNTRLNIKGKDFRS